MPSLPARTKRIKQPNLNLFPEDPFFDTFLGKTLRWATRVGRHIIIVTELIVIGSFASRFWLDRQLTDLNTSITQKAAIARSYGNLETEFRRVQRDIKDVQLILDQQGNWSLLERLTRLTPPGIKYEQLSFGNQQLSLKGQANSQNDLATLVAGLQTQRDLQQIALSNIESGSAARRDTALEFSITAVYVPVAESP